MIFNNIMENELNQAHELENSSIENGLDYSALRNELQPEF